MEPYTDVRQIKLYCKMCRYDFERPVAYGHYIEINEGSNVEILEERTGRSDLFLEEVRCPKCGCCRGLIFKD